MLLHNHSYFRRKFKAIDSKFPSYSSIRLPHSSTLLSTCKFLPLFSLSPPSVFRERWVFHLVLIFPLNSALYFPLELSPLSTNQLIFPSIQLSPETPALPLHNCCADLSLTLTVDPSYMKEPLFAI